MFSYNALDHIYSILNIFYLFHDRWLSGLILLELSVSEGIKTHLSVSWHDR